MLGKKSSEPIIRKIGKRGAEFVQVPLRMPPALHKKLVDSAAGDARSMNSEILIRLAQTFGDEFLARQEGDASTLETMAEDIRVLRKLAEALMKGETIVHTIAT